MKYLIIQFLLQPKNYQCGEKPRQKFTGKYSVGVTLFQKQRNWSIMLIILDRTVKKQLKTEASKIFRTKHLDKWPQKFSNPYKYTRGKRAPWNIYNKRITINDESFYVNDNPLPNLPFFRSLQY